MAVRLPKALRPFLSAQYRLLTVGLLLSLFGDGIWIVAVVWEVIEGGGTPLDLSVVATASSVGLIGAVLFGGVVADRVPQRQILVAVEATKAATIAAAATLALTDNLAIWHLAAVSLVIGVADGFFYPAYSALLPNVLPAEQLLAANGVEGVLRPTAVQAAGPAAAAATIALASPGIAFVVTSASQVLAVGVLMLMHRIPMERDDLGERHPIRSMFRDIREGFVYMLRTPWLLGTLLFALLLVLVIMGPIEVLLPFAVKDQTGGGAGAFAAALAAFGIGGAAGSMLVASVRLPRHYLTVMNLLWGLGCVPLAVIGFTNQLWVMVVALFVAGFGFSAATVIWGTLLQRRVPSHLLGRVSSLDFFVSLAFMPISMAFAGPVGAAIGIPSAFLIAGLAPIVLAVAAVVIFGMRRDELAHPLDLLPEGAAGANPAANGTP
jgi:MFS family permease